MNSLRDECTGRRPVHFFQEICAGRGGRGSLRRRARPRLRPRRDSPAAAGAGQSIADFYRAAERLSAVAFADCGRCAAATDHPAVQRESRWSLPRQISCRRAPAGARRRAQARQAKDVDQAEQQLSDAFVAYVGDLMRDPNIGTIYVDAQLRPKPPSPLAALLNAAPRRRSAIICATWVGCILSMRSFARRLPTTSMPTTISASC